MLDAIQALLAWEFLPWSVLGILAMGWGIGQAGKRVANDPIKRLTKLFGDENTSESLVAFVFLLWALLFAFLFVGMVCLLIELIWDTTIHNVAAEFRFLIAKIAALTAVLGGLVALPFTVLRLKETRIANQTAHEGLITDRINKAVEGLGATRTVKRQRKSKTGKLRYQTKYGSEKPDYSQPVMEEITEPTLEVRIGAILSLERISRDSIRDHIQIMEILCAYVRENSPANSAKLSPHEVFHDLTSGNEHDPGLSAEDAFQNERYKANNPLGWNPTELTHNNLERWARKQLGVREDIQSVLTVIGRRTEPQRELEKKQKYQIDLRKTNLQGASLCGDFDQTMFSDAKLDGALLEGTFQKAEFGIYTEKSIRPATMQAASCHGILATAADFSGVDLSSAFFGAAKLNKCLFRMAKMKHTNFNGASLKQCDFALAKPKHVYCYQNTNFTGSRFYDLSLIEFKGIDEGPSENLWINRNVEMSDEHKQRYKAIEHEVGELDDRREWEKFKADPEGYVPPNA